MIESSVATHRKFVGTACLYRQLAERKPPFLVRNLNLALDRQENLLAAEKLKGVVDGLGVEADSEMSGFANERREVGWGYPTAEMMRDLLKGQKPVLRLDRLWMRRIGSDATQRYDPDLSLAIAMIELLC